MATSGGRQKKEKEGKKKKNVETVWDENYSNDFLKIKIMVANMSYPFQSSYNHAYVIKVGEGWRAGREEKQGEEIKWDNL